MRRVSFLAILLLLGVFFIGCENQTQQNDGNSGIIGDIEWAIKDGVLTVDGEGALKEIPWQESVDCIQKVIIKDGVTHLPYLGFANYKNLNEIQIGNGISYIGPDTFLGCKNLETAVFGEGLRIIDGGAFQGCGFKEFSVPEGVYLINGEAFSECKDLRKIIIPETVTQIGEDVFKDCENVVVYTVKGSKAEEYAIEHGITCVLE